MLSPSEIKPFWQSKTLWSLLSLVLVTSAPPVAEMIEKKEFKPTKIASILVAIITAAPVAYFRSKASQPLGVVKPEKPTSTESVESVAPSPETIPEGDSNNA